MSDADRLQMITVLHTLYYPILSENGSIRCEPIAYTVYRAVEQSPNQIRYRISVLTFEEVMFLSRRCGGIKNGYMTKEKVILNEMRVRNQPVEMRQFLPVLKSDKSLYDMFEYSEATLYTIRKWEEQYHTSEEVFQQVHQLSVYSSPIKKEKA